MSRVLVAGHINHDRVWHLDRPLAPGGRLSCTFRETRLGGGAYHTGSQLLRLGHEVLIAGTLMDDGEGRAALSALAAMGFDTAHVRMLPGETAAADILLDPEGERTIIAPPGRRRAPLDLDGPVAADAAYVNAADCAPALLAALAAAPLAMTQFPLKGGPRPADIVIGSWADMTAPDRQGRDLSAIWARAREIAGPRLAQLVLTDGPEPVHLYDGDREQLVPVPERLRLTDTIGAGDTFAGSYLHGLLAGLIAPEAALEACRLTEARLLERRQGGDQPPPT